jgi:tetratricopeptide (TPR) repeat protein
MKVVLLNCGLCVVVAGLLGGCAVQPLPAPSASHEISADANGRAGRLYAQGDYSGALAQARRAYEVAASVEDEDQIAASLLNTSIIEQRLGHSDEARSAVERILASEGLQFSQVHQAQAALRRAILAAEDGQTAKAESLLERAQMKCPPPCALAGKIANLRAQLAIEGDKMNDALAFAETGLVQSRMFHDALEEANALRLGANAMIHLKRLMEAGERLESALAIDKRLALSRNIYRDLLLLGIAAQRALQPVNARTYLLRAYAVAQADHYAAGLREIDDLLSKNAPTK